MALFNPTTIDNMKNIHFGYTIYSPSLFPLEALQPCSNPRTTVFRYLNATSAIRSIDFAFELEGHIVQLDRMGHFQKIQTPFRKTEDVFFDIPAHHDNLPSISHVNHLNELDDFHAELPTSDLTISDYVLEDFEFDASLTDDCISFSSTQEHHVNSSMSLSSLDRKLAEKSFSFEHSSQQQVIVQSKKRKRIQETSADALFKKSRSHKTEVQIH
ncbi:hypothetical protein BD560DRAFT_391018 [Blakeslea trispora]|nr:hypothetical protein BD560DRAFT_391018 [Blakeslea trispora]